ncbi:MAG: hypothetical protein AB7G13_04390 [Lautropia sp.]
METIPAFGTGAAASAPAGPARRRRRRVLLAGGLIHCGGAAGLGGVVRGVVRGAVRLGGLSGLAVLAACTPKYDWREAAPAGADYRVRLPARPATLSRRIHLEDLEVEMAMLGAQVDDVAFTVAVVPAPAADAERIVNAMRTQMLRNVGAPVTAPITTVAVALIDRDGRALGQLPLQAVAADGSGSHAGKRIEARFGSWQGHALQAVIVGPPVDPQQSEQFFESLRLVGQ